MGKYDWIRLRAIEHIMRLDDEETLSLAASNLCCELCQGLWGTCDKEGSVPMNCYERVRELLDHENGILKHREIDGLYCFHEKSGRYHGVTILGTSERFLRFGGTSKEETQKDFERVADLYCDHVKYLDEVIDETKETPLSFTRKHGLGTAICFQRNRENTDEWDCQFRYADQIENVKIDYADIDEKFIAFVKRQEEAFDG